MTTPTLPPTPSTIANLPLASTPLAGTEWVPISQNGVTSKVASDGFTVVGPQGPAGPQGPTGATGPTGGAANIATGTVNDLAYYNTTTSLAGLATANNGILVTNGTGVPSIGTAIPSGVTATTQSPANSSTLIATTAFVNQGGLTLGTSTAATQSAADSSTKVATTAFVNGTALTLAAGTTGVTQSGSDSSTKVATTAQVQAAIALIPSGLTVGTTTIASGTNGHIEYNNNGVLGELGTTGSGNVVLASSATLSSPTFTTPALGTPASGNLSNCTGYPQQLITPLAVGCFINAQLGTGTVNAGSTTTAANLTPIGWSTTGTPGTTGDSLSGTWKAQQSYTASGDSQLGFWQRTV